MALLDALAEGGRDHRIDRSAREATGSGRATTVSGIRAVAPSTAALTCGSPGARAATTPDEGSTAATLEWRWPR